MNNNGYTEISTIEPTATFVANVNKVSKPETKAARIQGISDNLRYLVEDYRMQLKAEKWGIDFVINEHNLGKGGEQFQEDFVRGYKRSVDESELNRGARRKEQGEDVILRPVSKMQNYHSDNVIIGSKSSSKKGKPKGTIG